MAATSNQTQNQINQPQIIRQKNITSLKSLDILLRTGYTWWELGSIEPKMWGRQFWLCPLHCTRLILNKYPTGLHNSTSMQEPRILTKKKKRSMHFSTQFITGDQNFCLPSPFFCLPINTFWTKLIWPHNPSTGPATSTTNPTVTSQVTITISTTPSLSVPSAWPPPRAPLPPPVEFPPDHQWKLESVWTVVQLTRQPTKRGRRANTKLSCADGKVLSGVSGC